MRRFCPRNKENLRLTVREKKKKKKIRKNARGTPSLWKGWGVVRKKDVGW